jgi:hypothetical protein
LRTICADASVIDVDQFTAASQSIFMLPAPRSGSGHAPSVRQLSQFVYQLPEIPDMTENVVVLSGLAAMFCWTYIILPLIYYHS